MVLFPSCTWEYKCGEAVLRLPWTHGVLFQGCACGTWICRYIGIAPESVIMSLSRRPCRRWAVGLGKRPSESGREKPSFADNGIPKYNLGMSRKSRFSYSRPFAVPNPSPSFLSPHSPAISHPRPSAPSVVKLPRLQARITGRIACRQPHTDYSPLTHFCCENRVIDTSRPLWSSCNPLPIYDLPFYSRIGTGDAH